MDSPRRRAVLAALRADAGQTVPELCTRLDLPARHLAMLLWRMEEEGVVTHEGNRWFPALG